MPERLHPGVYVEEVKPAVRAIEGVSTSTAAFIGVADRGPVNQATLITSFGEYQRRFGGHRSDSFLTYSVQSFFDNGGKKCYVVRVVNTDPAASNKPATANVVLRDRERVNFGGSIAEDLLADILPTAMAEPVLTVQTSSPGKWGNLLDIEIQDGTRDPLNEFKMLVKLQDQVVETWDNLSLFSGDETYAENVLGGDQSQYIQVKRIPTATTDTPGALVSGPLDSPAQDLTGVADTPVIAITLTASGSTATVNKITLAKAGKNTGIAVAAEVQTKVRAAVPVGASAELARAFTNFECTFAPAIGPAGSARYVLVSGSDASPSSLAIPAATTGAGETDARARLKLDAPGGVVVIAGKSLQRGTSRSGNEPTVATNGNRNLSFNLNRDGFQTVQLDSGLSDGDAIAGNIQAKIRGMQTQRKDPANQNAYANFAATYEAHYELTFGDVPDSAGTFTFVASLAAGKDWSTDNRLRLRAANTTYGGTGLTAGPLSVGPGLFPDQRTIISGSTSGTRPVTDLSAISDGQLRLQVTPPAVAAINLDMSISGAGPSSGGSIAATIQSAVRAKAIDPALTGAGLSANTLQAIQAALTGFTAQFVAYYTLVSGDVRTSDAAGTPLGPLSSVEVLPSLSSDAAPALKLGLVNGGMEQNGSAMLRPALGEYHVGDNTVGGPVYSVTGGADGDAPRDQDYMGDGVSTSLNALDKITDVNLIAIPGVGSKQVVAKGFAYCANRSLLDCFFIADLGGPPSTDPLFRTDVPFATSVTAARDYVRGLPTKNDFGAIYFPWLVASDPIGKGKNPTRILPPSGYVAGMYARIDSQRGVFKAPAGTEANLGGALDLAAKIGDTEQDFLNPIGVNVIRSFPASGIVIWGARTLSSDSAWRYVPVRRTAIFLRVSIYNGIQFAVFEPNDDDLWASLRLTIGAFMLTQFRAGAFQGTKPDDAFFVKCDGTTTTQADIDNGVVNILVGFAPLKPAEFVVLRLSQKAGQTQS
jgi:phage tail sheath protein FI